MKSNENHKRKPSTYPQNRTWQGQVPQGDLARRHRLGTFSWQMGGWVSPCLLSLWPRCSVGTNDIVVWLAGLVFVKTGPIIPQRFEQPATASGPLWQEPVAKPGAGATRSAAQQDSARNKTLSHLLSQNTYGQKLHKSVFIYLQTITVYHINCQKHITFCFSFFKKKKK